jgi:hypothetical protein
MDADLRVRAEPTRPAVAQETQPRRLPFDTNAFVKRERLGNRIVIRRGMRADLLELADVLSLRLARRRERPRASR